MVVELWTPGNRCAGSTWKRPDWVEFWASRLQAKRMRIAVMRMQRSRLYLYCKGVMRTLWLYVSRVIGTSFIGRSGCLGCRYDVESMNELVFEIVQQADGGYCAECLTESIFTQADSWDRLRRNVLEAVNAFYFTGVRPTALAFISFAMKYSLLLEAAAPIYLVSN